ncbi:MAG: pentapeptide repeat-containing protein [Conexibacter sp.]
MRRTSRRRAPRSRLRTAGGRARARTTRAGQRIASAARALPAAVGWCAAATIVLLVAFAALKWAPALIATGGLHGRDRAEELSRARTAVLAVLAGMTALLGAVYTHRSYVLNREVHATNARLTREGQITERFTRAVDQLGSASLDIRLGGIYALERIARESPLDHGPVMEILTAWVREHARRPTIESKQTALPGGVAESLRDLMPATDVQAVLTVLGRRVAEQDTGPLNLRGAYLAGARLTGMTLCGADLRAANLNRASLASADLHQADLADATLQHADLRSTHLGMADIRGADFRRAQLQGANLIAAVYDSRTRSDLDLAAAFDGLRLDEAPKPLHGRY